MGLLIRVDSTEPFYRKASPVSVAGLEGLVRPHPARTRCQSVPDLIARLFSERKAPDHGQLAGCRESMVHRAMA
jgi:hypothetical protein